MISRAAASLISASLLIVPCCFSQQKELSVSELMDELPYLISEMPEPPGVSEAQVVEMEEGDPETYVFIKGAKAHPPKPVNLGGDGILTLTRPETKEKLTVRYRNSSGKYNKLKIRTLAILMRCPKTNRETEISVKLLEILDAIEDRFGKTGLTLLSAYRAPNHNKEVPGAARRSLHMLGWAADVMVPGKTPSEISQFARTLKAGGVGYYVDAGFVHLDSGRSRYWEIKRRPDKNKK